MGYEGELEKKIKKGTPIFGLEPAGRVGPLRRYRRQAQEQFQDNQSVLDL